MKFYSKHLEKLIEEKSKKLKDAERMAAIGATAGMVGHDIRNPLQAITSDVYLIKSDISSLPENEQKANMTESLDSISQNVDYINKIVKDLQDYSRNICPVATEVNLEALCEEILFNNSGHGKIVPTCKVDTKTKKIISDADLLRRIITNLVSNAVQAMPNGGRLNLKAFQEGDKVIIAVQDTGVGICEEVKPKLFEPLFTTKSRGQGFGLPVVKRLAEALGGSVDYDSELGKGATFIVRLPFGALNNSADALGR